MERKLPSLAKIAKHLAVALCYLALLPHLWAQGNPLNRKISVRIQEERLIEALDEIAEAGKFSFAYNSSLINGDSIISLKMHKDPVRWGLSEIFGEEMEFKSVGNHVVLRVKVKKSPEEPEFITLSGYLIDGKTGEKIPFATVYEAEKHASALTNKEGKYYIEVPGRVGSVPISFSRFGYRDTVINVNPKRVNNLSVGLMPLPQDKVAPQIVSLVGDSYHEDLPLADFFVPEPQQRRAFNIHSALARFPVQISLVPSIGTNGAMSGGMTNHVSLNVLAGYAQGLEGVEVGGIANLIREDVTGVQVGGIINVVGGSVNGIQVGGISNHAGGSLKGIQVGGIYNLVQDTIHGIQVSGIANLCQQQVKGLQIAGIVNSAPSKVDGTQIAGLVNQSRGEVSIGQISGLVNHGHDIGGFQIAGLGNRARGKVGASQIAGLYNIAKDSVSGVQIAGLYNKASRVKGVQIGLVNIADTLDGMAIGLLNWSRKGGYKSISVGANDVNDLEIGLRTGTDRFYALLSGGLRIYNNRNTAWSYGGGIGTRIRPTRWIGLELEYTLQQVNEEGIGADRLNLVQALRPSIAISPSPWLEIVGGPSLSYGIANGYGPNNEWLSDLGQNAFFIREGWNNRQSLWLGYQASLRLRF